MSDLYVDLDTLDGVARTFNRAHRELDAIGNSVPAVPDAGDGTAAVASMMSHLVENTSSLVLGLAGAGDDVAEVASEYRHRDANAVDELRRSAGEPGR